MVGIQALGGRDFAVLREVHTGSWLGRRYQGPRDRHSDAAAVLHLVRGRPALTRRLRLERAGWQAARTVPVQIHGLPACLPQFGLPDT